jgi:hypothetical protein
MLLSLSIVVYQSFTLFLTYSTVLLVILLLHVSSIVPRPYLRPYILPYCHTRIRYFTLIPIYTYVQSLSIFTYYVLTLTCYPHFLHVYFLIPRPIPCPYTRTYCHTRIRYCTLSHLQSAYNPLLSFTYLLTFYCLTYVTFYMSFLLYPGLSSVPICCLTVMLLSSFSHYSPIYFLSYLESFTFTCYMLLSTSI